MDTFRCERASAWFARATSERAHRKVCPNHTLLSNGCTDRMRALSPAWAAWPAAAVRTRAQSADRAVSRAMGGRLNPTGRPASGRGCTCTVAAGMQAQDAAVESGVGTFDAAGTAAAAGGQRTLVRRGPYWIARWTARQLAAVARPPCSSPLPFSHPLPVSPGHPRLAAWDAPC
jgi:hypothetical protein